MLSCDCGDMVRENAHVFVTKAFAPKSINKVAIATINREIRIIVVNVCLSDCSESLRVS
jgi:hypothetical protein